MSAIRAPVAMGEADDSDWAEVGERVTWRIG